MSSQAAPPKAPMEHGAVTPERIMQFAWGYAPPLIIEAAVRNGVFDALEDRPKTAAEVSAATGASERGLTMIMNALIGLELLLRNDEGRYSLTPESAAFLVSSKPSFLGGFYRHISSHLIPGWLHLEEVVRSGKPALRVDDKSDGAGFFEQMVADIFPMSFGPAKIAAEALEVTSVAAGMGGRPYRVLDIGAGSGAWGIAFAQASPHVAITAVDWDNVLQITQKIAAKFGLGDRLSCIPGNLRTVEFGTGYQAATIGHILHSEGAERSRQLLERVFAALAPGGSVVIGEFLVNPDRRGPLSGLIFGVNMLVNTTDGDTWSFEEIADWLRACGYVNARTVDCHSHSPLILADKPK